MSYSTGVADRDAMIVRVLQEATACRDPINVESLSALLPPDFELDHDELVGILSNMEPVVHDAEIVPEPHHGKPMIDTLPNGRPFVSPETLKKIEAPRAQEIEPPSQDAAQATSEPVPSGGGEYVVTDPNVARVAPKIAEAEARRALDIANQRLSKARDNMAIARGVLRERRSDLANAITAWQLLGNTMDNMTDAMSRSDRQQREIRNHLASTQAERAARVGRRSDTARLFVQRRMRTGPSRAAFSRSEAAHYGYQNIDPRRGAVRKLPSER